MVDREVFARCLGVLERVLGDLRDLAALPRETYLADRGRQAQAERWLHLAGEACLDLANPVIADQGWPTPRTDRQAFEILGAQGVIPADLAARMAGWAGLRNLLVHLYLEVDHARLCDILTHDLDELEAYAAALARFVTSAE
jgi:uncharacterized protein YutE (UPF0331/DUF86 family)